MKTKTLTITKAHLIEALMCETYIAGCPHRYGHVVAYDPEVKQASGRVICPMGISSAGGYMENYLGDENIDVRDFLTEGYDYIWGGVYLIRQDLGLPEGAEVPAEQEASYREAARAWIAENLKASLTTEDGTVYQIRYLGPSVHAD